MIAIQKKDSNKKKNENELRRQLTCVMCWVYCWDSSFFFILFFFCLFSTSTYYLLYEVNDDEDHHSPAVVRRTDKEKAGINIEILFEICHFQMKEWYTRTRLPSLCPAFRKGQFWIWILFDFQAYIKRSWMMKFLCNTWTAFIYQVKWSVLCLYFLT